MECLQRENSRSELLAAQIEGGVRLPVGRVVYTRLNTRIQVLEQRRRDDDLNTLDFLANVGRLLHF